MTKTVCYVMTKLNHVMTKALHIILKENHTMTKVDHITTTVGRILINGRYDKFKPHIIHQQMHITLIT